MPPRQIVAELDRYIVGQEAAKKAVAIAVRNRWRRAQAPDDIRDEITPYNIIMIGPTGVGKDRDRPPAGPPERRAVHQGRGLEVHRGGLRRPRRRVDGARPGGRRHQHGAHRAGGRGLSPGRAAGRRAAAGPAAPAAASRRRRRRRRSGRRRRRRRACSWSASSGQAKAEKPARPEDERRERSREKLRADADRRAARRARGRDRGHARRASR